MSAVKQDDSEKMRGLGSRPSCSSCRLVFFVLACVLRIGLCMSSCRLLPAG